MKLLLGVLVAAAAVASAAATMEDSTTTSPPPLLLPPYPTVRFTAWKGLSEPLQIRALKIGYRRPWWDQPGSYTEIEALDYESLPADVAQTIETMGLTEPQWDCYVNHYRNYDWEELTPQQARDYTTLGWNERDWDSDEEDESKVESDDDWTDLSSQQQQAASRLCYTQELWDEVALPLWESSSSPEEEGGGGQGEAAATTTAADDSPSSSIAETFEGPTTLPQSDRGLAVPFFRYQPWKVLNDKFHYLANHAGYDEKSWNRIGFHRLEALDFETIGDEMSEVQKALSAMGFFEDQWDCYVSHYANYEWNELDEAGVREYYETLGFTQEIWDDGGDTDAYELDWSDLTPDQKDAAHQLGYFKEIWDDVPLSVWPTTAASDGILPEPATATSDSPAATPGTAVSAAAKDNNRFAMFLALAIPLILLVVAGGGYAAWKFGVVHSVDQFLASMVGTKKKKNPADATLESVYGPGFGIGGHYTDNPNFAKNIQLFDDTKQLSTVTEIHDDENKTNPIC